MPLNRNSPNRNRTYISEETMSAFAEYMYKMQCQMDRLMSEIKNDASLSPKEKADYLNSRGITINGKLFKEEDFIF